MECSSKEMIGVDEIFAEAINTVVANDRSNQKVQAHTGAGQGQSEGTRKKKRNCRFL